MYLTDFYQYYIFFLKVCQDYKRKKVETTISGLVGAQRFQVTGFHRPTCEQIRTGRLLQSEVISKMYVRPCCVLRNPNTEAASRIQNTNDPGRKHLKSRLIQIAKIHWVSPRFEVSKYGVFFVTKEGTRKAALVREGGSGTKEWKGPCGISHKKGKLTFCQIKVFKHFISHPFNSTLLSHFPVFFPFSSSFLV